MIYYVNAAASRQGNGTKQMPFKHINDAAKIAMPGDVVSVAPGVYREYVNPIHAGREDARIEYRSEVPLGARITAADGTLVSQDSASFGTMTYEILRSGKLRLTVHILGAAESETASLTFKGEDTLILGEDVYTRVK